MAGGWWPARACRRQAPLCHRVLGERRLMSGAAAMSPRVQEAADIVVAVEGPAVDVGRVRLGPRRQGLRQGAGLIARRAGAWSGRARAQVCRPVKGTARHGRVPAPRHPCSANSRSLSLNALPIRASAASPSDKRSCTVRSNVAMATSCGTAGGATSSNESAPGERMRPAPAALIKPYSVPRPR